MEQNTTLFNDITKFGKNYAINENSTFQTLKVKDKKIKKYSKGIL